MRYFIFILFVFIASCSKTENRTPSAEQGIENNKNNDTSLISKREPILSYNSEPEEFTLIKMDTPTVFIKKDDNINVLLQLKKNESISSFITETDYYVIFYILEHNADNEKRTSLIYRKKDGKFFRFNANGGSEKMLYYINYETLTFDFFEINDNGIKNDITSVPMPNWTGNWRVSENGFLSSMQEIYIFNGTILTKYAHIWFGTAIIGSYNLFVYYSRYKNNNIMKLINLSNMKETNIVDGNLINITRTSIFFTDGNRIAHYDISTDTYYFLDNIIRADNKSGSFLSSYFIQGFKEYQLDSLYSVYNNKLLYRFGDKVCMYDFDTNMLYILFDYEKYPHSDKMGFLNFINNSYLYADGFGVSDLISLDEKRIIYRFIINWIDPSKIINDISQICYYETKEGDIIIYPVHSSIGMEKE
jgi:hypothetical protein